MASASDHRVLVPIDIFAGEQVPQSIVEAFASVPIVLLGYQELPDQTGTEQARDQFGDRARAELDELEAVFEDAGGDVRSRLVFTHDRLTTFERVAIEAGCEAVLILNPAPTLDTVLVAIRGDIALDRITGLLGTLCEGTDLSVTVLHVISADDDRERGSELLETAASMLAETGLDRDRIDRSLVVDDSPTSAILDAADDHDLLVVGESRPSVRRYIFRDRAKKLARATIDPVLVIRGEYLEPAGEDSTASAGDAADDTTSTDLDA